MERPRYTPIVFEAFEAITDSMIIFDTNWNYVYANSAALSILGIPIRELIGRNVWAEFPNLIGSPFELAAKKTMADRKSRVIDNYYELADSWFRSRITPIEDGIVMQLIDITELKHYQKHNEALLLILENALESNNSYASRRRVSL